MKTYTKELLKNLHVLAMLAGEASLRTAVSAVLRRRDVASVSACLSAPTLVGVFDTIRGWSFCQYFREATMFSSSANESPAYAVQCYLQRPL